MSKQKNNNSDTDKVIKNTKKDIIKKEIKKALKYKQPIHNYDITSFYNNDNNNTLDELY